LVSYCGFYCGDCFGYKGRVADLARDLRKELRACRFDKTAEVLSKIPFFKEFADYPKCYEVLGGMVKFRCKSCKAGGADPNCKIRLCCQKKGYEGCWECEIFETCSKLDFLKANHGDANIRNLKKIKRQGTEAFLAGKRYWFAS